MLGGDCPVAAAFSRRSNSFATSVSAGSRRNHALSTRIAAALMPMASRQRSQRHISSRIVLRIVGNGEHILLESPAYVIATLSVSTNAPSEKLPRTKTGRQIATIDAARFCR
jgi:hypothetical protein